MIPWHEIQWIKSISCFSRGEGTTNCSSRMAEMAGLTGRLAATSAAFLFFVALVAGGLISARWISIINTAGTPAATRANTAAQFQRLASRPNSAPTLAPSPRLNTNQTSTAAFFPPQKPQRLPAAGNATSAVEACPAYFRWIHEDLRPWKHTGITRDMVERARRTAKFRVTVLDGRLYVERYARAFQTRDVFTQWGFLQLLRRFPGRVPDLDLMFDCQDWPTVNAGDYSEQISPPPLFRYCGDEATLDIPFPDWSFWGWPEINIKPWEALRRELKDGTEEMKWTERAPYAFWKGNPAVGKARLQLLKCNVSDAHDWNARIYVQDWKKETQGGFKKSDLTKQCTHRYKIYIEGLAWSVSQKYILACNSVTLLVKPKYYDFFSRGLMPLQHYWPVRDDDKCRSIKFAVDWGNSHMKKAQEIGDAASSFVQEELKMDYVYAYMLHLLTEYARLLRYKPTKPRKAIELTVESMSRKAQGLQKKFMMDTVVNNSSNLGACELPPPFDPIELKMLRGRKASVVDQVEMWEQQQG